MEDELGMWLYQVTKTIQGEGLHAGKPIVLVRFMLCNLKCSAKEGGFDCDTYFTWDKERLASGYHRENSDLINDIIIESARFNDMIPKEYKADIVMLTGGEPLIWQNNVNFIKLIRALKSLNYYVTVETNGTQPLKKVTKEFISEFSISPKQSQYPKRYNEKNVPTYFDTNHFWKFVCGNENDVNNMIKFLNDHKIPKEDKIFVMPEGGNPVALQKSKDFINEFHIMEMLIKMGYDNVWESERLQIMGGFA